jgi:hypothetical protein
MDIAEYVEKYFEIKLFDCQKDFIKNVITQDAHLYILPARHAGRSNYMHLLEAILEWNELKESKN